MKVIGRIFSILSLFLGCSLSLSGGLPAFCEAIKPTKVKVAYAPISAYNWSLWVAETKGYFGDENLTLELAKIGSFPEIAESLSANAVDIAFGISPSSLILPQLKGEPVSVIGGVFGKTMYDLVALPEYRIQDLKDTTLGIPAFDPGSTALLQKVMSVNKLSYPYDYGYSLLDVSDPLSEHTAGQDGQFSGVLLPWPVSFMAEDQGMVRLANVATYVPEYQSSVIAVNTDWAIEHHETTVKFMKAIIRAQSWLHDLENSEESIEILTKYTKIKEKYAYMFHDSVFTYPFAIPKDASLNLTGMQQVIALEQAAGGIQEQYPVSRFVDVSYQQEANISVQLFNLQSSIDKILGMIRNLETRVEKIEERLGILEQEK